MNSAQVSLDIPTLVALTHLDLTTPMPLDSLDSLELRHLHTLVALAETGSLVRAAGRLHLTQSALSHQLRGLEEQIGSSLFERKSVPLRWTPMGERLVALAYDVRRALADASRDLSGLAEGRSGALRIAVECHSCFDWLMPTMDAFREHWPEVEQDLVSGFHPDPIGLLEENRAELVIVSRQQRRSGIAYHPLFAYHMPALMSCDHRLAKKKYLSADDFADETLIHYPIPDERLDLIRRVLKPAEIDPPRKQATLTAAILQLVASQRGIAALPAWAVQPYLERHYVLARPIGPSGLACKLWAATTDEGIKRSYLKEFLNQIRETCFSQLSDIEAFQ